jgi:hypothetical protein
MEETENDSPAMDLTRPLMSLAAMVPPEDSTVSASLE